MSDRDDTQAFQAVDTQRHEVVVEEAPPAGPPGPPPRALLEDVWPWLALLGILAVAALLVWLLIFRNHDSKTQTVPAVVGQQQQAAISRLTADGYSVKAVVEPAKRPRGIVFSQAPGGGSQLPKGATVTLHVSNGRTPPTSVTTTATTTAATTTTTSTKTTTTTAAATTQVPDVTGQDEASASGQIEAAGLIPDTEPVGASGTPGSVSQQSPPGGGQANAGATVTLDIVTGSNRPSVQVPNVVGRGAADARAALAAAKLTFKTVYKKGKAGVVLAETPTGTAPAYTQVTITVGG